MKRSVLIISGVCALSATAALATTSTGGRPWATVYRSDVEYTQKVDKLCDYGRAVYVGTGPSYEAGIAVAVVENAAECQFYRGR